MPGLRNCKKKVQVAVSGAPAEGGADPAGTVLLVIFHHTFFFSGPVTRFFSGALVMRLLAFCQTDFKFHFGSFPIQIQWYKRKAFAFDLADKFIQFSAVQKNFAIADRSGHNVGRSGKEWGHMLSLIHI